jgi:hypothetical protein
LLCHVFCQLSSLKSEAAHLRSQSANASTLESESALLREKVEELEFALAESQLNMNDNHVGGGYIIMLPSQYDRGSICCFVSKFLRVCVGVCRYFCFLHVL